MTKDSWIDKLPNLLLWFQRGTTLLGIVYVLSVAIGKGIEAGTTTETLLWVLIGIMAAALIALIHLGFLVWNMTYDWLTVQLEKYSRIRRGIVIGFAIATLIVASLVVFFVQMDSLLKAVIGVFFLLMLPSAITSMLQEDRRREKFALIGSRIAPEIVVQNPQAAIEHAFTLFEDHLRQRLGVGAEIYGESLINLAYGQGGRLSFGAVESEHKGIRNFVSGAYAVFRNPRKHRIVQDDKLTTFAIINVVELLMWLVSESTEKSDTL